MAIYELTMQGTLAGQAINNTYKYQTSAVIFGVVGMVNNWALAFKTAIQSTIVDDLLWATVHIRRLDAVEPGIDHIPSGWPFNGTNVGQYVSTFNAVRFNLQGAVLMYPYRGYKRMAGATEAHFDDGVLNAGGITAWTPLQTWMLNQYAGSFGEQWSHILYTERFPVANVVGVVGLVAEGTTQNTRKKGRGG